MPGSARGISHTTTRLLPNCPGVQLRPAWAFSLAPSVSRRGTRRAVISATIATGSAANNPSAATASCPTLSTSSPIAQAAAASAAKAAEQITTHNAAEEVAVWTSCRPLRCLPSSLENPGALAKAARQLPGYDGGLQMVTTTATVDLSLAERTFLAMLRTPQLDEKLAANDPWFISAARLVDEAVSVATWRAFGPSGCDEGKCEKELDSCHTFLQRMLYRLNRLNHFWYDDLRNYENERSSLMTAFRNRIECSWQAWEKQRCMEAVGGEQIFRSATVAQMVETIRQWAARDVDPPLSPAAVYIRDEMSLEGYRHLLAVGSLDGLVEASRQARVCSGAANEVSATVFRVLMEEYGNGRLSRKHSTFYHSMMAQMGLDTRPEAYFDLVPWQWLACANHNFLMTERRRNYLRYLGGLTYFEVNGPSMYRTYCTAAQRQGLPPSGWGYWELHVREDERHGRQMVEEVAFPLIQRYGEADGWEVLWGYAQEMEMGGRAGQALVADIKAMEAETAIAQKQ
ncbi:hypothetical protein Vafri_13704 [Volvox africanus]|uniref:Iron-containing redox enzyme family protein n=1 Tax=Volvox africanus TaxID=51714 RepID=A0A8J4F6U7_9CHLO|nr:hypothetical protein Vafri_13704 [Volvox africanus]